MLGWVMDRLHGTRLILPINSEFGALQLGCPMSKSTNTAFTPVACTYASMQATD